MRKLTVKKERLAELTTDDLRSVAAAAGEAQISLLCLQTLQGCTTNVACP